MKICQLLITKSTGGVAKHFLELTNGIAKSVETDAICPSDMHSSLHGNVQTKAFLAKKWYPRFFITIWLYFTLRRGNYDIVHAHGNKSAYHLSKVRPFIKAKCIATIHWILKKDKERKIYQHLDAVIGVGEKVLEDIKNPRHYVVHNGIPSKTPSGNRAAIHQLYNIDSTKPVAIAIGRLVKTKGFDTLVQSWQGIDATLLLVGEGPLRAELEQQVRELHLTDRVRFAGQIDNAVDLFPAVDLVIVSSIHEGFGYVIAEALVHEKALISTTVDFATAVLPKEVLTPPSDATGLHKLILYALDHPNLVQESLSASYNWASKNLLIEHMIEKILDCYRTVIDQP